MNRRNFLGISIGASVFSFFEAHTKLIDQPMRSNKKDPGQVRIKELILETTTSLSILNKFYSATLGLGATEKNGELIIQAGESSIRFVPTKTANRPFYHFAFNIPENKITAAFDWQKQKTAIIHPNPAGEKNQIVNFSHWNAHSIFFLDPAGNLLEYIARHDLDNAAAGGFSSNDILYISEIGFIVDDVKNSGNALMKSTQLSPYRDLANDFWPIGDESGLLLMIRKGREWTGLPGQPNKTSVFPTTVRLKGSKNNCNVPGYPYKINDA